MSAHIIRAHKIIKGIAELFTAMDKGFARVESDMVVLQKFRQICFTANLKLEGAIPGLSRVIQQISVSGKSDNNSSLTELNQEAYEQLLHIKRIISDNIIMISDFIDDFSDIWEKSFSINALIKFRLLLDEEYILLEDEIKLLEMQSVLDYRKKTLSLRSSLLKAIKNTGSSYKGKGDSKLH